MTSKNSSSSDQIDQPTNEISCPACGTLLADPEPGTDASGLYEVVCECGYWLELQRQVRVSLVVRKACSTVPPRVFFGLDPEPDGDPTIG